MEMITRSINVNKTDKIQGYFIFLSLFKLTGLKIFKNVFQFVFVQKFINISYTM